MSPSEFILLHRIQPDVYLCFSSPHLFSVCVLITVEVLAATAAIIFSGGQKKLFIYSAALWLVGRGEEGFKCLCREV